MILRALRLIFPMLPTAAALTAALLPVASCHRHGDVSERLDLADSLIEIRPDSSLAILDGIAPEDIRGKEQAARHALLKSMALDKNYVDNTTFDILQPAIDYYPEHGSPDEKLRTCYYQGRIYDNQGDDDSAMMCFMKASDLKEHITDSLVLARNFIMMSVMYHKQWKTEDYIEYCIDAARIYGKYGKKIWRLTVMQEHWQAVFYCVTKVERTVSCRYASDS